MSELYHIPNPSHRARFFERAAESVRAKAAKVYCIAPQSFIIPIDIRKEIDRPLKAIMARTNTGSWFEKCTQAVANSNLPPDTIMRVDTASRTILQRYFEAFYFRGRLSTLLTHSSHYPEPDTGSSFAALYINHRCNQAEAELEGCGLTQEQAHRLNGTLIGMSVQAYEVYDNGEHSYVMPMQGSCRNQTLQQITERIDLLRDYHSTPKNKLERNYKKAAASYRR